jgi:methyl acetate hydrolase
MSEKLEGTTMGNDLRDTCDGILQRVTTGKPKVPGVVAMITDRFANIYERQIRSNPE